MKVAKLLAVVALGALAAVVSTPASALSVNPVTGQITNWGVTPFTVAPYGDWTNGPPPELTGQFGTESGETLTMAWTEGNNVSPVDFPGGPPEYVPSPGGAIGEGFDLEFLAWRLTNSGTIQVLGITSVDPVNGAVYNGNRYHLGDVFINTDGSDATGYMGYDAALTGGNWSTTLNDPLHPADDPYNHNLGQDLYSIVDVDDVHGITDQNGYGGNPVIAGVMNPFAVREGAVPFRNGNVSFAYTSHNYGTQDGLSENNTYILEWEFNIYALPFLQLDPQTNLPLLSQLEFHWTVECGNDVIDRGPREEEPVIPEPATVAMLGLGLASFGAIARRRRRR
jgi:hypothetical protein